MNPNDKFQPQAHPKNDCGQCAAKGLNFCEGHGGGGGGNSGGDGKEAPLTEQKHTQSTPFMLNAMASASASLQDNHKVEFKPLVFNPQLLLELSVEIDTDNCQIIFSRNTLDIDDFMLLKALLQQSIKLQLNDTKIFATNDEIIIQAPSLRALMNLVTHLKNEQLLPPLNQQIDLKDKQDHVIETAHEIDTGNQATTSRLFKMEPMPKGAC